MNARKHSLVCLQRLAAGLDELEPTLTDLLAVLEQNRNPGTPHFDGSLSEESFNAAVGVTKSFGLLRLSLRGAIDMAEATEVGRRRRRP